MERYVDVSFISNTIDFSTGKPVEKQVNLGIKECSESDFKNRGNDY